MVRKGENNMKEKLVYNFQESRRILMILTGVKILKESWPATVVLNYLCLSVLTVILFILIGLAIATVLVAGNNVSLILEAAQFIVSLLIIALGLLNAIYHRDDLDMAADIIHNGIYRYDEESLEELEIKRKGVQEIMVMCKMFTIYIIFSGISYLLFIPLKELINPSSEVDRPINKLLPLPLFIPFQTTTISTYLLAFTINIVCMYCIIVLIVSIDEVYISLIIQIRTQFQILNYSITNLNTRAISRIKRLKNNQEIDYKVNNNNNNEFKRNVYICLKENIRHHLQLLRFTELVESYLGTTFLIIVALSSLIIAATGYLAVQYNNTTEQLLKFFIVLLSELLFVLHFCWFGEEVHTESEKLFFVLYNTEWYKYDSKSNKLLSIMMANCIRPYRLYSNLYKIPASLETFYLIVSRSYTYLNLLRQRKQ